MKKIGKKISSGSFAILIMGMILHSFFWGPLFSQETNVSASVDRTEIGDQDQLQLTVTVSGEASGKVKSLSLPPLKNLKVVAGPSVSTRFQWINGVSSSSKSFTYVLIPLGTGEAEIPSISVKIDGRISRTEPIKISISKGTRKKMAEEEWPFFPERFGRRPRSSRAELEIFAEADVDKKTAYQGEQVQLSYKVYSTDLITDIDIQEIPSYEGFWVEDLKVEPRPRIVSKRGKRYYEYIFIKKLLFPSMPGKKMISPLTFAISVQQKTGDFFEDFFGGTVRKIYRRTKPLSLHVLPLPEKGKPKDFSGAVGHFQIHMTMDKKECSVNDAINVQVTVEGYGNLKGITPFSFSDVADFKIYEPEVSEESHLEGNRMKSKKVWNYIFVPLVPGKHKIPKIAFSYFNPSKEIYETSETSPHTLLVKKGPMEGPSMIARIPKGEIRPLRRDIHFIKPLKGEIKNKKDLLYKKKWFYIVLFLPFFMAPALIGYSLRKEKIKTDAGLIRVRKAYKNATAGLKKVKRLIRKGDVPSCLQEMSRLMARYIADKFGLSPSGLTYEKIEEMLEKKNVPEEIIRRFRLTLESCDFTRFSKDSISADNVTSLLKEAEQSILALEKRL